MKLPPSAYDRLRNEIFPKISAFIRLYKTPQGREDEYVTIKPMDNTDEKLFVPSIYRKDRDIVDMLRARDIPQAIQVWPDSDDAKPIKVQVLAAWRQDPDVQRARLSGLCYVPGGTAIMGGKLNTYLDVSVRAKRPPDEGAIDDILHHIRHNICHGNKEHADYVLRWLAHMVQFPATRPKTAIAIIGDQGTGKGILVDFIKLMLGGDRNCNTTASSTDTKAFNFALANKLFIVFDEATFAGDRQQSDFMKKIVTEPRIRVEQKGVDAYEVDNYTRALITSNNMTSAVPTALGGRRWLTIECRSDVDRAWLKDLATKIGNNGDRPGAISDYAAWFKYYLENLDLTNFDTLAIPEQDTGFETKLAVLYREDPIKAFLWEWLRADSLTLYRKDVQRDKELGSFHHEEVPLKWSKQVRFPDFYEALSEHCHGARTQPPNRSRVREQLEPFGLHVTSGTANSRNIELPHPKDCLRMLRKTSRFDNPISPEQETVILHAQEWCKSVDVYERFGGKAPDSKLLRFSESKSEGTASNQKES